MFGSHRLIGSCLIVLSLCGALIAQSDKSAPPRTTPIVTVSATDTGVRITAPGSIVQIKLAVYSAAGEKLFETTGGGNVLDYAVLDKAGGHLAFGNYLCVVTVKSLSGKLSEKLGQLSVQENQISVEPAETNQLTVAQTPILSEVSEATPLTAPAGNETEAATVIAHNGTDGQMIRGRGALSFRLGDFFRAKDKEQMRLSETGDLDVAGTIRAQRFLVVKPDSAGKNGTKTAADSVESVQPLVWGTGTTGRLTKWMDGTGGLADSIMTETANMVGIGTTNPNSILELKASSPILTFNADTNDSYRGLNWMGAGYGANVLGSMLMNGHTGDLQIKSGYPGYGGFVSLHTNGLERMRATANGNIGIGTDSPNSLLELNSTTPILSFNANNRDSYHGMNWLANGYGPLPLASILMSGNSGELQMKSGYSGWGGFFTFYTNGIERMRINPNGNVGIGTDTPGSKLTVNGVIETTSGGIKFPDGTTQTSAGSAGTFVQKAGDTMTGTLTLPANGLTVGTNHLILSGGNVGIGTASPDNKLMVDVGPSSPADAGISIQGSSAIVGDIGVRIKNTGAGGITWFIDSTNNNSGYGGSKLAFTPWQQGAPTMVLTSANNVGIGTTVPGSKLTVAGVIQSTTGGFKFPDGTIQTTAGGGGSGVSGVVMTPPPSDNTFVGLNIIAGGNWNTFVGGSNPRTITGSYNTSVGAYVSSVTTSGTDNSIFGANAGNFTQAGNRNAFFGSASAGFNTTGGDNAFFGTTTGWSNVTGSNNSLLGSISDVGAPNLTNATAIGYRARVAQSNSLVLGSINGVNGATADTNVGIGTTTPQSTLQVNGYVQLALTAGAPPAADCDDAAEYGRMKVDATNNKLYVCTSTGWKSTALAP